MVTRWCPPPQKRILSSLAALLAGIALLACNPAPLGLTPTPEATEAVAPEAAQGQVTAPVTIPAATGPCPRVLSSEEQTAIADVVRRYQEALAALDRARVESFFAPRMQTQERNFALATIEEARILNLKGQVLPVTGVQALDDGATVALESASARLQLVPDGQTWKILTTRYRGSAQPSRVLALGTPAEVGGDLRVTFTRIAFADAVEDRATRTQIRPTPSGVFLVLFYKAENLGRERIVPATAFNAKLTVYDQDGRGWEYADELDKGNISARFAIIDGKESPERPLGPGFSLDTAVAFEVPANATGLCVPVGQLRLVVPQRG
jgi:hypothetical protein